MCTVQRAIILAATFVLLAVPSLGSPRDEAEPGFALEHLPYPGMSATVTLANGDIVAFDGTSIDRYAATGAFIANLGTLPAFAFPSFIAVDPTESTLVFGESSNGFLYTLGLSPGAPNVLTSLTFNYDGLFEDATHILVSAATMGFANGTQIFRVDVSDGTTTQIAQVAGPSGPIAIDLAGGLYYGTVDPGFPAPAGSSAVIRWSAADIAGGAIAQEADATVIESGFDGAGALAYDPATGDLYLAENSFGSGANRLRRVDGFSNPIVLEGTNGRTIANLEFRAGDGVARFAPYQPLSGGELLYNTTDFSTLFERSSVRPARPAARIEGLGLSGPGEIMVGYDGAAPNGFGFIYYNLQSTLPTNELVFRFSPPLFLGLDPNGLTRIPVVFATDSTGSGSLTFQNPGGQEGQYAFQFVLFDSGGKLSGSSTVELF